MPYKKSHSLGNSGWSLPLSDSTYMQEPIDDEEDDVGDEQAEQHVSSPSQEPLFIPSSENRLGAFAFFIKKVIVAPWTYPSTSTVSAGELEPENTGNNKGCYT